MNMLALYDKFIPLNLCTVCIGIQYNITDLPNAKSAVHKMLERMAKQVKQMIRVLHTAQQHAIHKDFHRLCINLCKIVIPIAICIGIRRK